MTPLGPVDTAYLFLHEFLRLFFHELERREWWHWVVCFSPMMLFFEIPRYYLSLLGLSLVQRHRGLLRRQHAEERRRQAFLRREPMVTVVVAGRNEEATIEACIKSLMDQNYSNYEVLIIDDQSEDQMEVIARRYGRRSQRVRTIRNRGLAGRTGRPAATNLGVRLGRGEFIISVDADCTFDRDLIRNMVAPFADPAVGVVAGNIHARNAEVNMVTRLQALEYALSIEMRKRWTDLWGCTLQASGALGCFRREAALAIGAWDSELAEDADISMRMMKAGWRIRFAPGAVTLTDVPDNWRTLMRQRYRWDRGGFRAYFAKHGRMLKPWVVPWAVTFELWAELLFSVVATAAYPVYLVVFLILDPWLITFALIVTMIANQTLSLWSLWFVGRMVTRLDNIWVKVPEALWLPVYKGVFRWVRFRALVMEMLHFRYEDSYLPDTVWREAPRW